MRMIIACLAAILAFVQEDKPGKRQATEKIFQMTIFAAVRPRPTNTGESAMTVPPENGDHCLDFFSNPGNGYFFASR